MASKKTKAKGARKAPFSMEYVHAEVWRTHILCVYGEGVAESGEALRKMFGASEANFAPVIEKVKKVGKGGTEASFVVFEDPNGSPVPMILVADRKAVVHECMHAVAWVLKDRGVPISYENDESMAYLIGHFVEKVMEIADAHDKKHNIKPSSHGK